MLRNNKPACHSGIQDAAPCDKAMVRARPGQPPSYGSAAVAAWTQHDRPVREYQHLVYSRPRLTQVTLLLSASLFPTIVFRASIEHCAYRCYLLAHRLT